MRPGSVRVVADEGYLLLVGFFAALVLAGAAGLAAVFLAAEAPPAAPFFSWCDTLTPS